MAASPHYSYKYQGGSLAADDPTYVWRPADDELFTRLLARELCYVFNARQMGKSSLRVRTMAKLQHRNINCAVIDLAAIGSQTTPEQWYKGVLFRLFRSLPTLDTSHWRTWWDANLSLPVVQRFGGVVETILLNATPNNIVIFLDEIDSVLNLNFSIDDFFAFIRTCYDQRSIEPAYRRLTFCFLGVATPSALIQRKGLNPFNIGNAIELQGFTLEHAKPGLLAGLNNQVNSPESVLAEVLVWTGGQPFLTQKLCQLIIEHTDGRNANVERIVRQYLLEDWDTQDEPEHLRTICDRILTDKIKAVPMLERYLAILTQGELKIKETSVDIELQLAGLVKKQRNHLTVTNYIYAKVFNEEWVETQLKSLWFLNQAWDEKEDIINNQYSKVYIYKVLIYHLGLIGICGLSLFLAYDVFHSPAWEYEYGADADIIEFFRMFILVCFEAYLVFFPWRFRAVEIVQGKTAKAKHARILSLAILAMTLVIGLTHNLYLGPQALWTAHQNLTGADAIILGQLDRFRNYFLPSFFYTAYALVLYIPVGIPFCLVSVFAATEDYSSSLDKTIDCVRRIDAIQKNSPIISRNITQASDIILKLFNRYTINFMALIAPYTTMFLGIEVIRTFEIKVGLETLTEPGQSWLMINYSYTCMAALIILWMFTHYQRTLVAAYEALTELGYDQNQFIAKNNIVRLLLKLTSLNINLILLALILVFNLIYAIFANLA